MGDAQRSACGPKHSLRKAVNRLTGTKKTRKVPIIRGPATGEALLHRSGRALGGRNLQADGPCLSVRLLGTTHWLTVRPKGADHQWREVFLLCFLRPGI